LAVTTDKFGSLVRSIEYAYFMRFQLIAGFILAIALPLSFHLVPSIFIGLFDGRGFWSFAFIVWAAFQLAWTVMVTCRMVLVYGPDRFSCAEEQGAENVVTAQQGVSERHRIARPVGKGTVISFGLLAVPLAIVLWIGSSELHRGIKAGATLLGLVAALCVLALTAWLHFAIEDTDGNSAELVFPSFGFLKKKSRREPWRAWRLAAWALSPLGRRLTAGILDGNRLRSGHEMSAIALIIFLIFAIAVGIAFSPAYSTPERQPAALFFLLFLLTIFTWFLSGAAFFLDKTRLPIFTTLLAASLLTGFLGTDHKFVVRLEGPESAGTLTPPDVIRDWEKGPRGKKSKTITVVATAGGGIRAAAWTAEVMTRLQEHCGETLSSSVLLISSVSGGSVGAMFVVGPYSSERGNYPVSDADLRSIRFNASRSSLSAVGWGLAYPDLARTAPLLGSVVPQTLDRGWSLENAWATAWRDAKQKPPFMKQWRDDVRAGTRPAIIFNATASESGDRFLIASTDITSEGTLRFFELFPDANIRVATAARLSATFPYVSPLARASTGPVATAYHVGDGGYYDNSGLLSAVQWLQGAVPAIGDHDVLLILIDAKPGLAKTGSSWSWQKQMIGPIETLLHVRTSSQQLRDSIDLKMAVDYLAANHVHVNPVPFLFSSNSAVPLSWHLTSEEIDEVHRSWRDQPNQASQRAVYGALGCSAD
jgi:hypothetical protein